MSSEQRHIGVCCCTNTTVLPEIVVFGVTIPLIVSRQGLALVPEHTIRTHLVEVLTAGRRGEGSPEYPCRRALVHPLLQRGPD